MGKILRWIIDQLTFHGRFHRTKLDAGQLDILTVLGDGYWEWNVATNEVRWSPKLFELLGLDTTQKESFELFMDLVHPEDRYIVEEELERYLQEVDNYYLEFRMNVGGEYQWFNDRGFLIQKKNIMIGTMTNIDERKRAELRLKKIMEASNDIFWEWNFSEKSGWIAGDCPHVHLTRFHLKNLFKKPNRLMQIYRKDRLKVLTFWLKAIASKTTESQKITFRILTEDHFRWVKCSVIFQFDEAKNLSSVSGSLTDIHEHKEIERTLEKKTSDLKESNDMLENFAFVASHDLQAPIRHIRHFSEFLKISIQENETSKINEYLSLINASTLKMKSLVQGLLEYSRLGRVKLNLERINIKEYFEEIFSLYELSLDPKDKFFVEINTNLNFIVVDRLLFRQVVQNLIDNSLKFRKSDVPFIFKIAISLSHNEVQLDFIDNGLGIDKLAMKNVFNLFYKGGAKEGNGIGLSLCHLIVKQHAGDISIYSNVGEGTIVTVSLPL